MILAGRGGDSLLRLILFPATAAVLDPRSFSLYALVTTALATGQTLGSLGAPRVALYFHARGSRAPLFAWLYLLSILSSAAVLGTVAFFPPLRRFFFAEVPPAWLLLGLAPLPFVLLSDSLSAVLLSSGRERLYSLFLWIRTLGSGLVLATSLAAEERLVWILAGRLVVHLLVCGALATAVRARPGWAGLSALAGSAVRYGLPVAASGALVALHRRADVFLLSAFGHTDAIGAYALAYAIAEVFWIATDSLEAALFTDLARREDAPARAVAARALADYGRLGLVALAVGLLGGEALLLILFRSRYPASLLLLPPVLLGAVAWGVARPLSSYFYSRGRGSLLFLSNLFGLSVNLVLCVLTIPRWGSAGAAFSTLVSYSALAAVLFLLFRAGKSREGEAPATT